MKFCDKRNSLIYNIFIHCHPPYTATNSGEQTLALCRGLVDFGRGKINSLRHGFLLEATGEQIEKLGTYLDKIGKVVTGIFFYISFYCTTSLITDYKYT